MAKSADFARNYARKIYFVNVPQNIPRGNIPRGRELCYIYIFLEHGMLRHSSNYPSFINSRHPDTPAYNPRDTIGGQLFQWCSVDEARREEEEEEDSIFYSRYRGDKSNKINQTPWRKTIGEKEQICFVYIEAFIDRPIYMHDLYALYARSLSKCSIWRELDSIIRELHHYFSSTFLPASMISACCRDKLWEKVGKSEGICL